MSSNPRQGGGVAREPFVLYMEGPRDRGVLQAWSRRLLPSLARRLSLASVILGGRQPARALAHFRRLRSEAEGLRAVCVLDRDDGVAERSLAIAEPGLEFFTWSRRHIESYLLVPAAIRRALRLRDDDARVERILRAFLPTGEDESAYRALDAKRLLGAGGVLPRALGRSIPLAQVARATHEDELHADVHALFARLRDAFEATPRAQRSG